MRRILFWWMLGALFCPAIAGAEGSSGKNEPEIILSQPEGADAQKSLAGAKFSPSQPVGDDYPAGKTPEEAWQTLLRSWQDKVRDPNLGVYTALTRIIYQAYRNFPDSRDAADVSKWIRQKHQIIVEGRYAVIFFSDQPGWENAPFLFCRTPAGWQWDIVSQRKYVRFGPAPAWGIERADEPYADLLSKCPYYQGVDMPITDEDIFHAEDDERVANRIKELEAAVKVAPADFSLLMELGRLNTISARDPQETFPLLEKAELLDPTSPLPYKYLAIRYVDSGYQYQSAIPEVREYIVRAVTDPFGYNFLGYLFLQTGQYEKAVEEFKKALTFDKKNVYAYEKLARSYFELFIRTSGVDPRRKKYQALCREMFKKAEEVAGSDNKRIRWLKEWLKDRYMVNSP